MRIFARILAVAAAVGLSAGAAQAAFDFTDTANSPRQIELDGEGWQDLSCRNLYNNPPGLPPAAVPPCVLVAPYPGCPNHPNNRAGDPSCVIFASSPAGGPNGPFWYPDPVGIPSNDYFATATFVGPGCTSPGSCKWKITTSYEIWGQVLERTLRQVGAAINAVYAPFEMIVDFGATGVGSVTNTNPVPGPFGLEFYFGDAFFGPTQLGLHGVMAPGNVDGPYFGQGQQPFITIADPGVPLSFSCSASSMITPPITVGGPFGENGGGGAPTTTLTGSTANFNAVAALLPPQLLPLGGGTIARFVGGPNAGVVVDITGHTATTLTIANPLTVVNGELWVIEAFGTITGAPFPQGLQAGACPNTIGNLAGLLGEPGYDLASSPGVTQLTTFINAYTALGTSPLTNPVWAPTDARLEEVVDTDADGIPDRHDNCDAIPNGPLAGPPGCYCAIDNTGACIAGPGPYPTAVGFQQLDEDGNGIGNPCDGDFNQDGAVNSTDVVARFAIDLGTTIPTPGWGTDMNCDGAVNTSDIPFYSAQAGLPGAPGTSGLWCAGAPPLVTPCLF